MREYSSITRIISTAFSAAVLAAVMAGTATAGNAMLYLVEFEALESGAPGSPGQTVALLDDLIIPSLEQLASNDAILSGGLLAGARAGVIVLRADSHEAVTDIVRALPAWGVWSWKVTPLESFAYRAGVEKKVVKALRGQK